MFKTLWIILITVILTIIIEIVLFSAFIWFKNPYGIRTILFHFIFYAPQSQQDKITTTTMQIVSSTSSINKKISTFPFTLTAQQKSMLHKVGIDPNKLPTTLTPALKTCLVNTLGIQRYNQIITGHVPDFADLLNAKSCLIH